MNRICAARYIDALCFALLTLLAQAQSRNFGVDVSAHQGVSGISQAAYDQLVAEGRRFVFIKATEGLTGADDQAMRYNVDRATLAGLLVGVYHYAHAENRPTTSGAVQEADHFVAYAGNAIAPGRLRPVLDVQGSCSTLSTTDLTAWVIAFCDEVVALRGPNARPIIYTQQRFTNYELDNRLADYDLWLQTVGTTADPATDDPPPAGYATALGVFKNWSFWQYNYNGTAGGITPMDLDVCHDDYKPIESYIIPAPGALQLAIWRTTTNTIVVSWPLNSIGFTLQRNAEVDSTNWVKVVLTPHVVAGRRQIVAPSPTGIRFYRLVGP
jgi:GH25 family lysozyme M1 (1,4-beta-N-acetylmuramidase)